MLDRRVETAQTAIEAARESRDIDTKSSVGDKHETGRAMMQIELEKSKVLLSRAMDLKKVFDRINIRKGYEKVEFGSLVVTDQGNYFLSVGMGKMEVGSEIYYSISLASPIGKILQGRKIGDKVKFQHRKFTIEDIF